MNGPGRTESGASLGEPGAQRLEGRPSGPPGPPKDESFLGEGGAQRLGGLPSGPPGSAATGGVRWAFDDGVAVLTLDGPGKRNALDATLRDQLAEAVRRVRRDAAVRAVVLTGAGGHFCAGGDLRGIGASRLDNGAWRQRMATLHEWLREWLTLDKPVIAAVDGAAAGAGFSLALAADFVLATPRARFCMSFIKVGLVPDLGAFHTLPRVVGVQRARELMLSGRDVDAEEALRLGIVMELHEPAALLPRARALARSFCGASPTAVSLIKRALEAPGSGLAAMLEAEANAQALAMGTPEHHQAVAAFLEKRPPPFAWPARPPAGAAAEPVGVSRQERDA